MLLPGDLLLGEQPLDTVNLQFARDVTRDTDDRRLPKPDGALCAQQHPPPACNKQLDSNRIRFCTVVCYPLSERAGIVVCIMEDTRCRWERAYLEALEYDTWGQARGLV